MKKFTKNEINRILNKPELYEAVMRYDYLLNNRNKIDEIYKYYFCKLYKFTYQELHMKKEDFEKLKNKFFKLLKKYVTKPNTMPNNIDKIITKLKTKNVTKNQYVFASKLMHTVQPNIYPIWDKYTVFEKYNHYKNRYKYKKKANEIYLKYMNEVNEYIQTPNGQKILNQFKKNKKYQNLIIEDNKIIDFVLWQDR